MKTAVIFGGSGFVGIHYADYLLNKSGFSKVYLYDLESIEDKSCAFRDEVYKKNKHGLVQIRGDVRIKINWAPPETISLIVNLAAIHREPGHKYQEYYETNICGAENICSWATNQSINTILFTSSISPYEVSNDVKYESTTPKPNSAYGNSKLIAEKIHEIWQKENQFSRNLIIFRPGVIYGPSEKGNVSRMIHGIKNNYFFYLGNKNTVKSSIYIKELCRIFEWALDLIQKNELHYLKYNATQIKNPTILDFGNSIIKVGFKRKLIPSLPYWLVLLVSYIIDPVLSIYKKDHPFKPRRIVKLKINNNISSKKLLDEGYEFKYDLESSLRDWRDMYKKEW